MTIAVSAVVHPSRTLLFLLVSMSALAAAIGVSIFAGWVGEFDPLLRLFAGLPAVFIAFFGFYHGVRQRKTLHIDISATGQIRIGKMSPARPCKDQESPHLKPDGTVVEMLDDSTLWPFLLVLRLRDDDGRIEMVTILQDSVSSDVFRALSVACRWIAARSGDQRHSV